ncbi:MAG: hypothetical protein NC247_05350 [Ruminococcus flavefaciens]|nr:hypothetical protein [Ruminococcus flavefaciens]MCM1361492.1 hypothetical protein [Clostridiales bacterium]
MAEYWITVKEAATLLNVSERAIQLNAERRQLEYKYVPGKGKNGQQLRILLESLMKSFL